MHAEPAVSLDTLVGELERHPVNSNAFFQAFKERYLNDEQLQVFLRQYHYFCKHFVKLLEGLLYHTPVEQLEMRVELIKTLHSEHGKGRLEQAHITLLNRFARALGLNEEDLERTTPSPTTRAYLQTLHRLFIESEYLVALGAELAVETTAASEFTYLYPGLLKYQRFQNDELEFFKLHISEESCHSDWLIHAVRNTAGTPGALQRVAAGARETAEAWHAFWEGVYADVFAPAGSGTVSQSPLT